MSLYVSKSRSIVFIEYARPEAPSGSIFDEQTWFLRGASSWPTYRVFVPAAFEADTDVSMVRLFQGLGENGETRIKVELSAVLPDRFPDLDGSQEYSLGISGVASADEVLCVSNQMRRVRFVEDGKDYHVFMPHSLAASDEFREFATAIGNPEIVDAPLEHLTTAVSMRFDSLLPTTDKQVVRTVGDLCDRFIRCVNLWCKANTAVLGDLSGLVSPAYGIGQLKTLYVIAGNAEGRLAHGQLATTGIKSGYSARSLTAEESVRLVSILSGKGEIDEGAAMLFSARSYIASGMDDFALLQLAVAAEMATKRFVRRRAGSLGLSQKTVEAVGLSHKVGRGGVGLRKECG